MFKVVYSFVHKSLYVCKVPYICVAVYFVAVKWCV